MSRLLALALCALGTDGWWGAENATKVPEPEGPWKAWAREKVPGTMGYVDSLTDGWEYLRSSSTESRFQSWDQGLWSLIDGLFGIAGWAVFGSAWGNVKVGCRRALQLCIVLMMCVVAHYVWAVCWPIVSFVVAFVMTIVWILRKVVRLTGRGVFTCQRLLGGTPEAVNADYYGPGYGAVPDTAELRRFKWASSQEKWVVLKRSGETAVFKVSNDNNSIKSSGLYVGIEPDSLRGTPSLLRDLRGHDKVHLCRHGECSEDGQHFKVYGLAQRYDPERFELALASEGARQAGSAMWGWAWARGKGVAEKVKDYASESEADDAAMCIAHRVRWTTSSGDVCLSQGPCTKTANERVELLYEDEPQPGLVGTLCPTHATKYLSQRYSQKCSHDGCKHYGQVSTNGTRVCWHHGPERGPSRTRSRSRDRRARYDGGEAHDHDGDREDNDYGGRERAASDLLDGLHGVRATVPRDHDSGLPDHGRRKRLASRSPGTTPKSQIHRQLAKMGLLDSPDHGDHRNWLEEFLERYAQGREVNLSEEQTRLAMARERGVGVKELTRILYDLAVKEKERGQRGLTKFVAKWAPDVVINLEEEKDLGVLDDSSSHPSWSLISSTSPTKLDTPPGLTPSKPASPQVVEQGGAGLVISAPTIYGRRDRLAGAASTTATPGDPMSALAQAIQSQTAEIASLVKAQHDQGQHPPGSVKGLTRLSEEMVFIMRACDQYQVAVCPGEVGAALANALLAAQVGAATKLRAMGFRQKMTHRLAVGLAGPYWGAQDRHCLGAADFIHYSDAELDAFSTDRTGKQTGDQKAG